MSDRRCATEGCLGTVPAGIGKHCPRCGGTAFIPTKRSRRWIWASAVLVLALGGGLLTISGNSRTASTTSHGARSDLIQARALAARMYNPSARDEAYADVIKRAIAQHEFEFACSIGGELTLADNRDKSLQLIVEEALKSQQPKWATHATEYMVTPGKRDAALKRIMEATAGK